MQERATHSFLPILITVPVLVPVLSATLPILSNNNTTSYENDEYSNCEEDNRKMEALGLGDFLAQSSQILDSLETQKRQRTQAVGSY